MIKEKNAKHHILICSTLFRQTVSQPKTPNIKILRKSKRKTRQKAELNKRKAGGLLMPVYLGVAGGRVSCVV